MKKGFAVADGAVERIVDADGIGAGTHAVFQTFMGIIASYHQTVDDHIDRALKVQGVGLDDRNSVIMLVGRLPVRS